jgi:SAM-dependent methyltransferase
VIAAALSAEAFEARYRGGNDPWSFAKDRYELGRYRTILGSLQRSAYGTVYEPGCSVGVLTQQLAMIARRVVAADFAPSAVEQARERCATCPNVEIVCADAASFVPTEPLDLIVFSEIGYYFAVADLSRLVAQLAQCLIAGGEFIAVHWLGNSMDHLLHGDRVHEVLHESLALEPRRSDRYPGFRLDSWVRP